jgi:hypothetical protein
MEGMSGVFAGFVVAHERQEKNDDDDGKPLLGRETGSAGASAVRVPGVGQ